MERIFALGSNGSGQLGIGHREDVSEPVECLFDEEANNSNSHHTVTQTQSTSPTSGTKDTKRKVKRIVSGGNHTLILFEDGAVYAAGLNSDLRCGVSTMKTVDAGLDLGTGDRRADRNDEQEDDVVLRFKPVVFNLGEGAAGMVIDRFKDVCATWSATCFVASIPLNNRDGANKDTTKKDIVVSLGTGDKGELGLGPGLRNIVSSSLAEKTVDTKDVIHVDDHVLADFPPVDTSIVAVGSGMNHVVAILSNGDVYGWGASRKAQLGSDADIVGEKVIWAPVKIDLKPVVDRFVPSSVSCGREFTFIGGYKESNETDLVGEEYMYTILGMDGKWNIVSTAPSLQMLQKSGQSQPRYDVSTSWHGVYLHDTVNKSVIAWGRNDRGQLGVHDESFIENSTVRWDSISRFMAGSEHAIAVLSDNRTVVSCGWGEHGNCGPDTDERGNVKGRLSQIRLPNEFLHNEKAKVIRVGAGCATSWMVVSS